MLPVSEIAENCFKIRFPQNKINFVCFLMTAK